MDRSTETLTATLTDQVGTIEDAYSLIHALRSKFTMVGTEFSAYDVRSMVEPMMEFEDATEAMQAAYTEAICQHVMDGYAYQKMADRLAARGNDVLGDATSDAVGALQSSPACVVLGVDHKGQRVAAVESQRFPSAPEAHLWALEQIGKVAREVEGERYGDADDEGMEQPIAGFTLVALDRQGHTQMELDADLTPKG